MTSRQKSEHDRDVAPASPEVEAAYETLRRFGLGLPETVEAFPWGESALKVRKKVFAFLGHGGGQLGFSVKLPDSGADVLCMPFASPTGYGLGKSGWVTFRFDADELPHDEDLEAWVEESFRAVAPKAVVRALDRQRAAAQAD